ncbi:MAG: DUF2520 domain-containing protein [Calditrichaeota bacterium]|nr:DUF2520 domain-containing protein [Calditrichota bacterium]
MQDILIIGFGKLGSSLERFLVGKGFRNINVVETDKDYSPSWKPFLPEANFHRNLNESVLKISDFVFISVPDDQILPVARALSKYNLDKKKIVHTSGAVDASVLDPLKNRGALTGSWHPLQTFNQMFLSEKVWDSIVCSFQGDETVLSELKRIFSDVNLQIIKVNAEQKKAIHTAAVVAANYQVALYGWAQEIIDRSGLKNIGVSQILGPLVRQVVENFSRKPLSEILTGPLQRGDIRTIEQHLNYLKKNSDAQSVELYKLLALKILENPDFPVNNRSKLGQFLNDYEN